MVMFRCVGFHGGVILASAQRVIADGSIGLTWRRTLDLFNSKSTNSFKVKHQSTMRCDIMCGGCFAGRPPVDTYHGKSCVRRPIRILGVGGAVRNHG